MDIRGRGLPQVRLSEMDLAKKNPGQIKNFCPASCKKDTSGKHPTPLKRRPVDDGIFDSLRRDLRPPACSLGLLRPAHRQRLGRPGKALLVAAGIVTAGLFGFLGALKFIEILRG